MSRRLLFERLFKLRDSLASVKVRDLFSKDKERFKRFSIETDSFLFDYSKQRITEAVMAELCGLASESGLEQKREALFSGAIVNPSEGREALHTALRTFDTTPILVDGQDIKPAIKAMLSKMAAFRSQLLDGTYLSASNKRFQDIICLGIGGSSLGPSLVCEALSAYQTDFRLHFISNVDGNSLSRTLKKCDPNQTLCLISSKTFTTSETLENAKVIKSWFKTAFGEDEAVSRHLVGITANIKAALSFGIAKENLFEFWDWVGGRFSVWSAVGLPIVLALGIEPFKAFLKGAYQMDEHFQNAPLSANIPVLMGLLSVWNTHFWGCHTHAILPYEDALQKLPPYLQQLEMESNGKSLTLTREVLNHAVTPIIWGGVGSDNQHAYMQLLHQGAEIVPADFLLAVNSHSPLLEHQRLLVANCFSQSKALMEGTDHEGKTRNLSENSPKPFNYCAGNRPSSTLLYTQLTPETLGALLALYEHKVFVQSVIWDINPFDQWGVELGKTLAKTLLPRLTNSTLEFEETDSSTQGLIEFFNRKIQ